MTRRSALRGTMLTLILSGRTEAGVIRVPEDFATVPGAIDAAAAGDSVLIGPGHWTDTIDRSVSIPGGGIVLITSCGFLKGGISVIGTAGPEATIIDGGTQGAGSITPFIFVSYPASQCVLDGLAVTGGEFATIFARSCEKLVVRNCRVYGSQMVEGGVAISADRCNLVCEDSEVSFNSGGGISGGEGDVEVRRCRIEENGRGAFGWSGGTPFYDRIVLEDCEIIGHREPAPIVAFTDYEELLIQRNRFERNVLEYPGSGGTVAIYGENVGGSGGTIRFNTFVNDSSYYADGIGGLAAWFFRGEISNNTFVGCYTEDPGFLASASALSLHSETTMVLKNNVISYCGGQPAVQVQGSLGESLEHSCNVFWQNTHGDYWSYPNPIPPDISADPLFCNLATLDLTVRAGSPCAPGTPDGTPGCGSIGAWPVGCGSVAVQAKSWAQIKALYR